MKRLPDALERHGHVVEAEKALPRAGHERGHDVAIVEGQRSAQRHVECEQPATNVAIATARSRRRPRTRAGATARAATSSSSPSPGRGCSSLAQLDATIAPSAPASNAVLAMCGRPLRQSRELRPQVVSRLEHGERDPRHAQAKQERVAQRLPAGVHQHE